MAASDITRRGAIGALGAAAALPRPSLAKAAPPPGPTTFVGPLFDRDRASAEMRRSGLDAIVAARAVNIFYLTTHDPLMARMGFEGIAYAVLPRDQRRRPCLVMPQFAYYYGAAEDEPSAFCDVRLFTSPANADAYAARGAERLAGADGAPAPLPQTHDAAPLSDREKKRRAETEAALAQTHATAEQALAGALREIDAVGGRIGVDDFALAPVLTSESLGCAVADGEAVLRRIRLQKTAAELPLARRAAAANAEAGLAAARTAREGASLAEVRAAYAAECAARGLTPHFMVVDRVISERFDAPLEDGRAFMIDCVSRHLNYHGDYGRTIFMGDPPRAMQKTAAAMSEVWTRVREALRPGLRYSEIVALAGEAARKAASPGAILCNPHSVGLHHTDEPGKPGLTYFQKDDHELIEGMVLSVDVAMVDAGLGGSAHLEDLVLITADGAELMNAGGDHIIRV